MKITLRSWPLNNGENNLHLFVSCASELEPLLMDELTELGFTGLNIGYRGVYITEWDWDKHLPCELCLEIG